MRTILLTLLISTLAFGGESPLTPEQFRIQKAFDKSSKAEGWTFNYNVRNIGRWATGYVRKSGPTKKPISIWKAGQKIRKAWDILQFPHVVTPIMDQGGCGSCVVFSFSANFMESLRLRGLEIPELSPQHLMNCGTGGQCSGANGEGIAGDLVNLKNLHTEKDYPYTARSGRCQEKTGQRHGTIISFDTIEGNFRNIAAAINAGQPVSVGVAANGSWSSYSGGRYNGCNSFSTNHYVVIEGYDCEGAVDEQGFCKFDANGNLPAGVGTYSVRNSWSNGYGINGRIITAATDSRGRACNNIAGENGDAQVLNIGIPMPTEEPVDFVVESNSVRLNVKWKPNAKYTVQEAKQALEGALRSVEEQ